MILRPYQIRFIKDVSASHQAGNHGVIGQMPTGSGKTVCMSRIAKAFSDRGGRVLIVVHRDELVKQTCKKLEAFDLQFGIIASGLGKNPNQKARIQVSMVQTLSRRITANKITSDYNYIIFDECHLAAAKSYQTIMNRWPNAKRLGLSATPWRLDGQGLALLGSAIVKGPTIVELIDEGSLVPFITYSLPVIDFSKLKIVRGEYDAEAQSTLFKKAGVVGDVVDHYFRLANHRSGIVFASSVDHSLRIRDKFIASGVVAEHIDGNTPTELRDAVLKRLDSGQTTIVCNYGCLTEGFDSPRVSVIIIARKTASSALFRQMGGRGLRLFPGKTNCFILDHGGNAIDHGNLDWEFQYSLEGRQKGAPQPRLAKTCPTCCAVCDLNAEKCHVCGESFLSDGKGRDVKESDGTLVAIPSGLGPVNVVKPEKKHNNYMSKENAKSRTEDWLNRKGFAV